MSIFKNRYWESYGQRYVTTEEVGSELEQTEKDISGAIKHIPKVVDESFKDFVKAVKRRGKYLWDPFHAHWMIRQANVDNPAVREANPQTQEIATNHQVRVVLNSKAGHFNPATA